MSEILIGFFIGTVVMAILDTIIDLVFLTRSKVNEYIILINKNSYKTDEILVKTNDIDSYITLTRIILDKNNIKYRSIEYIKEGKDESSRSK